MTGIQTPLCYVDDFLLLGPAHSDTCHMPINKLSDLCTELGVPLATDKTEGPSTQLTFLGVQLDSVSQTISLPPSTYNEIRALLDAWSSKKKCTKRELQSIIGSLVFAANCVPTGRLFTRRMINLLADHNSSSVTLSPDFHLDIKWWREFHPRWNGHASFLSPSWTDSTTIRLYADALGAVCGGFFDDHWFSLACLDWLSRNSFSIEFLEIVPIYISCLVWKDFFINRHISFSCDNLGACHAWSNLGSSSRAVLQLLRLIASVSAQSNVLIRITHVAGIDNSIADALSRLNIRGKHLRSLSPEEHTILYRDISINADSSVTLHLRHSRAGFQPVGW
ncbi:hypothetical protein RvY_03056 [Ramazzottius varieornatus]|uniref:Reverse transcriptase domain-containing protein n=1 Tax=Ramazzottius varieornatus TaxID=947166 RepID=A0A1D1UMK8_RAMVA|nr:hypothetical protein RvY_03056 [Ramazzottius varieornatus]